MTRTVVIGLDGGNWPLVEPWLDDGELPNIESIVERGVTARSHSFLPPVTVPNWKCYSTGKNPGELGVYRFDRLDVENRRYVFHHSTDFDSAELWDYLNDSGYTTGVVNMPTTYPPRQIEGVMVCGGPDAREGEYRILDDVYTYPAGLQKEIEERYDYSIHPRPLISSNAQRGAEVDAIHELIEKRFEVAYDLFTERDLDFLHVTSFYSNTLQHFFWRDDPVHEAWRIFDRHVGRFLELEDVNVVIMSDHGCAPVETVFYPNVWLQENGCLTLTMDIDDVLSRLGITKERALSIAKRLGITDTLARAVPTWLQTMIPWEEGVRSQRLFEKIDWDGTSAIANQQGLVYVTETPGTDAYREVRAALKDAFAGMTTPDGSPVAVAVHEREDLYSGRHVDKAPDLVIEFPEGIHIGEAVGTGSIFCGPDRWDAENVPPGLFAATGPDVTVSGDLGDVEISDIAPTVLGLMDCAIPTDLDGSPLEIFADEPEWREPLPTPVYDAEQTTNQDVQERLENLGYLSR